MGSGRTFIRPHIAVYQTAYIWVAFRVITAVNEGLRKFFIVQSSARSIKAQPMNYEAPTVSTSTFRCWDFFGGNGAPGQLVGHGFADEDAAADCGYFFGGSSRTKAQETSAVWPLS